MSGESEWHGTDWPKEEPLPMWFIVVYPMCWVAALVLLVFGEWS